MNKRYIVMGSSGKHELDNRWIVASFTSRAKADEWCDRCNYYGEWVARMEEEAFGEQNQIDRERNSDNIDWSDDDAVDALPLAQWEWAVQGTFIQQKERMVEVLGEDFSDNQYRDFISKEWTDMGWMLNPYDPQIYPNLSMSIRYEVIEVEEDPPLPKEGVERDVKVLTLQALRDPQPGDRFHEMYSYWVYVVRRDGNEVWYCEANPPCKFPQDAKLTKTTVEKMLKHFTNDLNTYGPTPWVRLSDRGNDVKGWIGSEYVEVVDER